jgi:UPF0755 protein
VFLGALALLAYLPFYLLEPTRTSGPPVMVDIPNGASASTIAERLKKAGVIRSATLFTLVSRVLGYSGDMKAGEYRIPSGRSAIQIMEQLVGGAAEAQWVTIPEGQTLAQIGRTLEQRRLARHSSFMQAALRKPKRYGLDVPVSRRSVEGYLMPDTYKFPRSVSEQELIQRMLENWNAKVLRPNRELFVRSDLPMDKIIIMASMIEREARVPQDRPKIARVIRNRLGKKMKLQIDATVIYALGRHKKEVTFKDLKVESPYNTYKVVGLPPGPICNPGLDSILAALQPAAGEDLYYVAQPDGSHIFSRTYEEHKAAIQRVRDMKAAAPVDGAAG